LLHGAAARSGELRAALVDFLTVYANRRGSCDSQADPVALNRHHHDLNAAFDDDRFTQASAEN
jgi:hypothetical protein